MEFTDSQKKYYHDLKVQIHCVQPHLTGSWIVDLLNTSWRIQNELASPNDYTVFYIRLYGVIEELNIYLEKISLSDSLAVELRKEGFAIRDGYQLLVEGIQETLKHLKGQITSHELKIIKYVRDREAHLFTQGYIVSAHNGNIATDRNGVDRIELRESIVHELRKFKGGERGFSLMISKKIHSDLETIKEQFEKLCDGKSYDMYITNPKFLFET